MAKDPKSNQSEPSGGVQAKLSPKVGDTLLVEHEGKWHAVPDVDPKKYPYTYEWKAEGGKSLGTGKSLELKDANKADFLNKKVWVEETAYNDMAGKKTPAPKAGVSGQTEPVTEP